MIQIIGLLELILFYFVYFLKLFLQGRKGIKTNHLGRGDKGKRTIVTEKLLKLFTFLMVPIILIGLLLNTTISDHLSLRGIGLALSGIGTCFFILAIIKMRDSWRVGIPDKDRTDMVTGGIFRISRNPAFLGFDLTYIGVCLTFGNVVVIIMAVITIAIIHLQILEEEKYLGYIFGEEYLAYKNKVGRYLWFIK